MTRLTRFWRAVETLSGLATVTAEWRVLLGREFDLAKPLLRPRGQLATSFPRLPPASYGPPYRIVAHAPDDYVKVCPQTGESTSVSREDLVVFEVNRTLLAERVAAALGLERDGSVPAQAGRAERVGDYGSRPGERLPVFLTFPLDSEELHTVVVNLLARRRAPFLLLAPTRRRLRPETESALRVNDAFFLALAEILSVTKAGQLQAVEPLDVILSRLRGPGGATAEGDGQVARGNIFRKNGDLWTLAFGDKTVPVKDQIGLAYVAHLIANQGRDMHAAMLAAVATGRRALRPVGGSDILDDQAMAEFRRRYEDLRFQQEEAERHNDPATQERVQEEIDALTQQLSAATGLGGRKRKMGDDAEKSRKAVSNAITRAVSAIEKKHPALARHLDNSIRRGQYLRYAPEADLDWTT